MWGAVDVGARGGRNVVRLAALFWLREVCCHRGSTEGLGCAVGASACPKEENHEC